MASHDGSAGEARGTTLLGALRRRWWLPLVCALSAGAAAYALTEAQATEYEAKALLAFEGGGVVAEVLGSAGSTDPEVATGTRIALLTRERVALGAVRRLRTPGLTVQEVQDSISIGQRANANVLEVRARREDPVEAARMANAYSQAFVDRVRADNQPRIREALRVIEGEIRSRERARGTQPDDEDLAQLRERRTELILLQRLDNGSVTLAQPASPPDAAATPGPARNTLLGLLLGGLLGVAAVAALDQADRRLRSPDELEEAFGARVLSRVPKSGGLGSGKPFGDLSSADAEPFRLLHAQLRYANGAKPGSVVVTSARPLEGKTTTAWNLASAAAAAGENVLLVEADLRSPSMAKRYDLAAQPGLADVLLGDEELADAVQAVTVADGARMDVVVGGGERRRAAVALMQTDAVPAFLKSAGATYSLIVIDTPPVTLVADAIPFTLKGGTVVAVCRRGSSTRDAVEMLRDELDGLQVRLAGVVANGYVAHDYGYYG